MASYLSSAQKTAIKDVFNNMHDTFARDITIYQTETNVFVATNDTYNALYKRLKNSTREEKTVTSTTAKARILYISKQMEKDLSGLAAQINVPIQEGMVRLKITEATYNLFKKATKIEVDGDLFNIVSNAGGIGQFDITYYTIYLERAQ